jgi:hypothetical protein
MLWFRDLLHRNIGIATNDHRHHFGVIWTNAVGSLFQFRDDR